MKQITIIGYGEMGQALHHLLKSPYKKKTIIWDRVAKKRNTQKTLPQAVEGADYIILALPTQALRVVAKEVQHHIASHATVLYISKGVEQESGCFPSQILEKYVSKQNIVKLSGPMIAEEIMRGNRAAAVCVGSKNVCTITRNIFLSQINFQYAKHHRDVDCIGVLKNIYAVYIGMLYERGVGMNVVGIETKKIYDEMRSVMKILKAKPQYVDSLAGVADFVATAWSDDSSNRKAGQLLMRGKVLSCEGIASYDTIKKLLGNKGQQMPCFMLIGEILKARTKEKRMKYLNKHLNAMKFDNA